MKITKINANKTNRKKKGRDRNHGRTKTAHLPHSHLTAAVDMARDIEHLNAQLRSECDSNVRITAAKTYAFEEVESRTAAHRTSMNNLSVALEKAQQELLNMHKRHAQYIQNLRFDAMMQQEAIVKKLEGDRERLLRKIVVERHAASNEGEKLQAKIASLECSLGTARDGREKMAASLMTAKLETEQEKVKCRNAMDNFTFVSAELETAKAEVTSVRDDLAELQRLNVEEGERRDQGLPPAYGGLDDIDVTPPWEKHCVDVGRLDGGMCGQGMTLLESITDQNFACQLRKAQAIAGKERQSFIPAVKESAGANFFGAASEELAQACVSLISGMDKVQQLDAEVIKLPTSAALSPPPISSKKRHLERTHEPPTKRPSNITVPPRLMVRLPANLPPSLTVNLARAPSFIKIEDDDDDGSNHLSNRLAARHSSIASHIDSDAMMKEALRSGHLPTKAGAQASNHSLAHRAIHQIFSLLWQTLSAFELRPMAISLASNGPLRLKVSTSWRIIDDTLTKAIESAARIPFTDVDEQDKCTGCGMQSCVGNCARLGRLQGYATQMETLMKAFRGLVSGLNCEFLAECYAGVEDMVSCERRVAAVRGGRARLGSRSMAIARMTAQRLEIPWEEYLQGMERDQAPERLQASWQFERALAAEQYRGEMADAAVAAVAGHSPPAPRSGTDGEMRYAPISPSNVPPSRTRASRTTNIGPNDPGLIAIARAIPRGLESPNIPTYTPSSPMDWDAEYIPPPTTTAHLESPTSPVETEADDSSDWSTSPSSPGEARHPTPMRRAPPPGHLESPTSPIEEDPTHSTVRFGRTTIIESPRSPVVLSPIVAPSRLGFGPGSRVVFGEGSERARGTTRREGLRPRNIEVDYSDAVRWRNGTPGR